MKFWDGRKYVEAYFLGGDGQPIKKGDACLWMGNKETIWIIMSEPCGMTRYDSVHPDSDYMDVWAKPSTEPSNDYKPCWVRRKTKGFTLLNKDKDVQECDTSKA